MVVSGGAHKTVRIWDLTNRKKVNRVEFQGDVRAVVLASDEGSFFAGGDKGLLK